MTMQSQAQPGMEAAKRLADVDVGIAAVNLEGAFTTSAPASDSFASLQARIQSRIAAMSLGSAAPPSPAKRLAAQSPAKRLGAPQRISLPVTPSALRGPPRRVPVDASHQDDTTRPAASANGQQGTCSGVPYGPAVRKSEQEQQLQHGSVNMLTPVRASKSLRTCLGSSKVVLTPVRRSARRVSRVSKDIDAEALLELTSYCYTPNKALGPGSGIP